MGITKMAWAAGGLLLLLCHTAAHVNVDKELNTLEEDIRELMQDARLETPDLPEGSFADVMVNRHEDPWSVHKAFTAADYKERFCGYFGGPNKPFDTCALVSCAAMVIHHGCTGEMDCPYTNSEGEFSGLDTSDITDVEMRGDYQVTIKTTKGVSVMFNLGDQDLAKGCCAYAQKKHAQGTPNTASEHPLYVDIGALADPPSQSPKENENCWSRAKEERGYLGGGRPDYDGSGFAVGGNSQSKPIPADQHREGLSTKVNRAGSEVMAYAQH